jgi:hypothetical protein
MVLWILDHALELFKPGKPWEMFCKAILLTIFVVGYCTIVLLYVYLLLLIYALGVHFLFVLLNTQLHLQDLPQDERDFSSRDIAFVCEESKESRFLFCNPSDATQMMFKHTAPRV